jgi:hypothetical protein
VSIMELGGDYYCHLCGPYIEPHRYHCGNCNGIMQGEYSHYHGMHMDPVSNKFVKTEHHFKCDPGACEQAHATRPGQTMKKGK